MDRTGRLYTRFIYTLFLFVLPAFANTAELTEQQRQAILLILGSDFEDSVEIRTDHLIALGSTVHLHSSISGSFYNYVWTQIAGPAASLSGSNTPQLTVQLPHLSDPAEFAFALSVSGPDGELLEDDHSFTAFPNNPPELTVQFPCDGCRINGTALSFRGYADSGDDEEPILGADAVSVAIQVGETITDVPVGQDGIWRLADLAMPAGIQEVMVTATDAFDAANIVVIDLENVATLDTPAFSVDPTDGDVVYALETDSIDRLVKIELPTGERTTLYENRVTSIGQVLDTVVLPGGSQVAFGVVASGHVGAFSTVTGELSTLSGINVGEGPAVFITSLDLDTNDNRLVAYGNNTQTVSLIDTLTGNRAELVTDATTSGIAVDGMNDLVFYIDGQLLYSADLDTGDSTLVGFIPELVQAVHAFRPSSNEIVRGRWDGDVLYATSVASLESRLLSDSSSGLSLEGIHDVLYDASQDRYIAVDFSSGNQRDTDSLVAVNPTTGDRSLLFKDEVGSGPYAEGQGGMALGDNNNLYLCTDDSDSVIEIDLDTGRRTLISDSENGFGIDLEDPSAALFSSARGLLVLDNGQDALMVINVATGDRSLVSEGGLGAGPGFSAPVAMAFNHDESAVYVVDTGTHQVLNVHLDTGNREVVSDNTNTGPPLEETDGVALDYVNNRLIVGERSSGSTLDLAVVAIDLESGDRTRLAAHDIGSGPNILDIKDLVVSSDGSTAYLTSWDRIFRVDLETGDRTVLADNITGNGDVVIIDTLEMDPDQRLLYGWNPNYESLLVIDLETGDRVIRSR